MSAVAVIVVMSVSHKAMMREALGLLMEKTREEIRQDIHQQRTYTLEAKVAGIYDAMLILDRAV